MTQLASSYKKPENQTPANFVMVKNCEGSLSVPLNSSDFIAPSRRIVFKYNEEKKYIPLKWAAGVFVTPEALKQLENGYFLFENMEELIKAAESMDLYVPDPIKEPKIDLKEVRKALVKGDVNFINKITSVMTQKLRRDITKIAQQNYSSMSVSIVKLLEKKLGTSLETINLDG